MAQPTIVEGTGEELLDVLKQAPHDRYRLIRITEAAPVPNGNGEPDVSLAEAFRGHIGVAHFGDANLSQDTGKKFTRLLLEKHRKEQEKRLRGTSNDLEP